MTAYDRFLRRFAAIMLYVALCLGYTAALLLYPPYGGIITAPARTAGIALSVTAIAALLMGYVRLPVFVPALICGPLLLLPVPAENRVFAYLVSSALLILLPFAAAALITSKTVSRRCRPRLYRALSIVYALLLVGSTAIVFIDYIVFTGYPAVALSLFIAPAELLLSASMLHIAHRFGCSKRFALFAAAPAVCGMVFPTLWALGVEHLSAVFFGIRLLAAAALLLYALTTDYNIQNITTEEKHNG